MSRGLKAGLCLFVFFVIIAMASLAVLKDFLKSAESEAGTDPAAYADCAEDMRLLAYDPGQTDDSLYL